MLIQLNKGLSTFWILALSSLIFSSCAKSLPNDGIPAYLYIADSVKTKGIAALGEQTNRVFDVRVSVGNEDRGIWEIPSLIPILQSGTKDVVIKPYILRNNNTSMHVEYPMLNYIVLKNNFVPKKIDTLKLTFEYDTNVVIKLQQSFDNTTNFSNSSLSMTEKKSGIASMHIKVDSSTTDTTTIAQYNTAISLDFGAQIYMEFDFKMNDGTFIPTVAYDNNGSISYVYGTTRLVNSSDWKHVYWYLSPQTDYANKGSYYIAFILTPEIGKTKADLYIDNLKILQKF
jgi:hypothetical protein